METLFALVLTSCLIDTHNVQVCEEFQVDIATTQEQCEMKKMVETNFLTKLESLDCDPVTYEKE